MKSTRLLRLEMDLEHYDLVCRNATQKGQPTSGDEITEYFQRLFAYDHVLYALGLVLVVDVAGGGFKGELFDEGLIVADGETIPRGSCLLVQDGTLLFHRRRDEVFQRA